MVRLFISSPLEVVHDWSGKCEWDTGQPMSLCEYFMKSCDKPRTLREKWKKNQTERTAFYGILRCELWARVCMCVMQHCDAYRLTLIFQKFEKKRFNKWLLRCMNSNSIRYWAMRNRFGREDGYDNGWSVGWIQLNNKTLAVDVVLGRTVSDQNSFAAPCMSQFSIYRSFIGIRESIRRYSLLEYLAWIII